MSLDPRSVQVRSIQAKLHVAICDALEGADLTAAETFFVVMEVTHSVLSRLAISCIRTEREALIGSEPEARR